MTSRSLLVLAGTTAAAVVLAVIAEYSFNRSDAISGRGSVFLPGLISQAGSIATIMVKDGKETITVNKDGDRFVDSSGFPVKNEAISSLVTSLSMLTVEEKKTADQSRHGDLDLAEPTEPNGAGKKLALKTENGNEIAGVVIGKSDYSVGGANGGQYVRLANEDETYLVRGSVKLPFGRTGWFDTSLLETDASKIVRAVLLDGDATTVELTRSDEDLKVANLPAGKVGDENKIDRTIRLFESLKFTDVRARETGTDPRGPSLIAETAEGLSISISALQPKENKDQWVRITAKSIKDDAEDATRQLSAKFDAFDFKLSSYDMEPLAWSIEDFTSDAQS